MIDFLQEFHSGWRYVVIAFTVFLILFFIFALLRKNTRAKLETTLLKVWIGIVDLQILLGILLLGAYLIDGVELGGEIMGHIVLMLLASTAAHGMAIYQRFNGEPTEQTRRILGVVLPILTMILIYLGVSAIGRGLFEKQL